MKSAICTVYEGDYHYGVGALINSVANHGFQGTVYVGYRGNLPAWTATMAKGDEEDSWVVREGCQVRFISVDTTYHLSTYKPAFMRLLWKKYCCDAEAIFYFDPDITIKCDWEFFDKWVSYGVALCEDSNYAYMPTDYPHRIAWRHHAESRGFKCNKELSRYYNSGFIGVKKNEEEILETWETLIDSLPEVGVSVSQIYNQNRSQAFYTLDQDVLNMAVMVSECSFSTIGPDGMGFIPGGFLMSHAIGIKPWRKKFIRLALSGAAPTYADKQFLQNSQSPIALYSPQVYRRLKLSILVGAMLGRFIKKR